MHPLIPAPLAPYSSLCDVDDGRYDIGMDVNSPRPPVHYNVRMSTRDAGNNQADGADAIDRLLETWEREWPGLDVSPLGVISRINRASRLLTDLIDDTVGEHGLPGWGYRLLATLRQSPNRQLTPTALARAVMVTSGAMTKQLDRLEDANLLYRMPDPDDRRGILIGLTPRGRELIDQVILAHIAHEHDLLAGLTPDERDTLAALLRKLLLSLGDAPEPDRG